MITPPRYALKFLRWFCREDYLDEVEGDIVELFTKQHQNSSLAGRVRFLFTVLRYFRPEYLKVFHRSKPVPSLIPITMISSYLLFAFRNLRKRSLFSFINIFGLAIGVSACLLILVYIDFETSYDKFHVNASSLYRINRTFIKNNERLIPTMMTTYGLGPALQSDFPEVIQSIRTHEESAVVSYESVQGDTKSFHEEDILVVDSVFLQAFTFSPVYGNLASALNDPNSIVLTQTMAAKYFGNGNPVGSLLTLAGGRMDGTYTVTAVMEDVPQNSHFRFTALLPLHNILQSNQYRNDGGWGWNNFTTYIQLAENTLPATLDEKLSDFSRRRLDPKWKEYGGRVEVNLQPLRDIHLHPGLRHDGETISRNTIYFFATIALFILFIAWINYINLSTARAMERAKEVGIKKTIGAYRSELMSQFLFESIVINFIGIVLAVIVAMVLLPLLGQIIGKELSLPFADPRLWLVLTGLFAVGTLASGAYPAVVLSSFKIANALNVRNNERHGLSLRKGLVVFQFASSLMLIAGTFVIDRQLHFMEAQDKGLQMDQMLVISGPGTLKSREAKQQLALFKEEVRKIVGVEQVASSGAIPSGGHNWGADIRKSDAPVANIRTGSVVWVDPDFIPAYQIAFEAGRNFNAQLKADMKSVIINEASLKAFDLGTAEEALDKRLILGSDTVGIIGVLKNYNWNSLKAAFDPFILCGDTLVTNKISIHIQSSSMSETIESIGRVYKSLLPNDPFEYRFLDDAFNEQYKSEQQFGKIFALFAGLAVVISCLGLWGLASFTISQKMKEIGVRKVLGASVSNIVYLLSGQFLRLVVIAAAIALPLTGYLIQQWLNGFAFRMNIGWELFVFPLLLLVIITLLTVSLQVFRGASANPARVLKTE